MKTYGYHSDPSKLLIPQDENIVKLVNDDRNISDNEFYQTDIELNFTAVLFAIGLIVFIILTGFIGEL